MPLHDTAYTSLQLDEWARKIHKLRSNGPVFVYFQNDRFAAAEALELRKKCRTLACEDGLSEGGCQRNTISSMFAKQGGVERSSSGLERSFSDSTAGVALISVPSQAPTRTLLDFFSSPPKPFSFEAKHRKSALKSNLAKRKRE